MPHTANDIKKTYLIKESPYMQFG